MGKTDGSLGCKFPLQGGGRSPGRVHPVVRRKTERPLVLVIVVVVVVVVV